MNGTTINEEGYLKRIKAGIKEINENINLLKNSNQSDILYNDSINIAIEQMQKRKLELLKEAVNTVHNGKISVLQKEGTVYYRTYVRRKSVSAKDEDSLYEKLAEIYQITLDDTPNTFEKIYPLWHERFKLLVSNKNRSYLTLEKYEDDWNKHFKHSEIVKKDVRGLKVRDFRDFFEKIAGVDKPVHTKTDYNNLRALLNQLIDYSNTMLDIPIVNLRGTKFNTIYFEEVDRTDAVYTDSEREKILSEAFDNWDRSDYYKAIVLHFYSVARVGEIRALKWKDFDFDERTIYINGYMKPYKDKDGNKYEEKTNYTKAHADNGKRTFNICDDIYELFDNLYIKRNPLGEDFVFQSNGKVLNVDAYNHCLKAITKRLGIKYLSSHKIRFWAVTNMFENGIDEKLIQKSSGHDNARMTRYYNRCRKPKTALSKDTWNEVFSLHNKD